jgi:hypothetical protein
MKSIVIFLTWLLLGAAVVVAQPNGPVRPAYRMVYVDTDPPGTQVCTSTQEVQLWVSLASGKAFTCQAGVIAPIQGAGVTFPVTLPQGGTNATTLTQAQINLMGMRFAAAIVTGGGNNGIANGAAAGYNFVIADPSYGTTEQYNLRSTTIPSVPANFHLQDIRSGLSTDYYHTWKAGNFGDTENPARFNACTMDGFLASTSSTSFVSGCNKITSIDSRPGWSFGSAVFGINGWYVPKGMPMELFTYGAGIHETRSTLMQNFGVGDTVPEYYYVSGEGGWTAPADEGTKGIAANVFEDPYRLQATCTTGCTTGSTAIKVTTNTLSSQGKCTNQGGGDCAFGVGRYLIDITKGGTSCTEASMATGISPATAVTVAGCSLPVSNAWGTLSAGCGPVTPADNITTPPFSKAYSCTVAVTSGTFDNTHLLCLSGSQFHECVVPTSVTAPSGGNQTLTMNLRKPHAGSVTIYQGGMAGTGIEFSFYNQTGNNGQVIRYLFDVLGSTSSTVVQAVWYKQGVPITLSTVVPEQNLSWNVTSLSNSGTTVSGIYNSGGSTYPTPYKYPGVTWTFSGASDSVFNTSCTNFAWITTTFNFTCTIAGLSGSHTATTAVAANGQNAVVFWPMAEVTDVQNEAVTPPIVDGTMALEPNIVAFSTSDVLEETHHASAHFEGGTINLTALNPFNLGRGLNIGYTGAGARGGGGGPTANGVLNLTTGNANTFYQWGGGWFNPPNLIGTVGAYNDAWVFSQGSTDAILKENFSSLQENNPNYNEVIYATQSGPGHTNIFAIGYNPYTGNTSWTISGGGVATWSAASHVFIGPVALPSGSTINGSPINASAIANVQQTTGTSAVAGNTCTADLGPITMTGLATTSSILFSPSTDVSGITGWGATGGLVIAPWPTVNTLHYKICNQTGTSITPGSVTWNVSAK